MWVLQKRHVLLKCQTMQTNLQETNGKKQRKIVNYLIKRQMAFKVKNASLHLWNSLGLLPPQNLQFPLKWAEGKG